MDVEVEVEVEVDVLVDVDVGISQTVSLNLVQPDIISSSHVVQTSQLLPLSYVDVYE